MGKSVMLPGMLCRLVVLVSIPVLQFACLQCMENVPEQAKLDCWSSLDCNDHACMAA